MQLWTYAPERHPSLASRSVRRRMLSRLYYVHDGRNAWYTTWVMRYFDGCMHTSLESAKTHAEALRVQGSRFYIFEMPALVLEASDVVMAVTQINCTDVLAGYSPMAVRKEVPSGAKRITNARENYLRRGSPLEGAFLSFDHDSRFWKREPPRQDSVIRVFAKANLELFEPLGRRRRAFQSRSIGGQYHLLWTERPNGIRAAALRKLLAV